MIPVCRALAAGGGLRRAATTLVCLGALVAGCGGDEGTLDGRDLETALRRAMDARLGELSVREVDCVFLSASLTRCFAEGSGAGGGFRLPVSVARRDTELVWSVAEDDLRNARRGVESVPLRPGEAVALEGRDRERVQVRVREPIDPLEVNYPEVPPKYGSRYVAVPVEIRNRGPRTYVDSPLSRINATLSDGALITHAPLQTAGCDSDRLARVRLEPGERVRACVAFEVPDDQQVESVALQLGYSESVLEWQLADRRTES